MKGNLVLVIVWRIVFFKWKHFYILKLCWPFLISQLLLPFSMKESYYILLIPLLIVFSFLFEIKKLTILFFDNNLHLNHLLFMLHSTYLYCRPFSLLENWFFSLCRYIFKILHTIWFLSSIRFFVRWNAGCLSFLFDGMSNKQYTILFCVEYFYFHCFFL